MDLYFAPPTSPCMHVFSRSAPTKNRKIQNKKAEETNNGQETKRSRELYNGLANYMIIHPFKRKKKNEWPWAEK
jgi:hypothetical protein